MQEVEWRRMPKPKERKYITTCFQKHKNKFLCVLASLREKQ